MCTTPFYFILNHGFPRPILPTKHLERSEGCFVDKIGRGNPWLRNIFNFPKKELYTILSSFEMKMRVFFPENFAERMIILRNCPKGR